MPIGLNNDTDSVSVSEELVATVGTIVASTRQERPTGYLLCDGSAVQRTTYSRLFSVVVPNKGTVTVTSANPGVVTLNSHGFLTGESVFLTTSGALPTSLTANTLYYVISVDTNTFRLATTYANAIAGTAINTTTGTQSGAHTLFYCPYGIVNSQSTTFNLPDLRGAVPRGAGTSAGYTQNVTVTLGTKDNDQMQGHKHTFVYEYYTPDWGSGNPLAIQYAYNSSAVSAEFVGYPKNDGTGLNGNPRTGNETKMKNQGVNFFIKF